MRPHGNATIDQTNPRALGVCDRCGFLYNLYDLGKQQQWAGPKLQTYSILVCKGCTDKPQQQLRTIILPQDPVPVKNARPERYLDGTNPGSALGVSANFNAPQYGNRIGSLTGGGGINSAFDGNAAKQSWQSAVNKTVSDSSYGGYVGIDWRGPINNLQGVPADLLPPMIMHSLSSVTISAPVDRGFLGNNPTGYVVQYGVMDTPLYGAWTTISSGTTAGTPGEVISLTVSSPQSQFHRVAFQGDGLNYISVAQVQFSVAETGGNSGA